MRITTVLVLVPLMMMLGSVAHTQTKTFQKPGKTWALLLNGGARPDANYLSHFEHLQEMMDVLIQRGVKREHIAVFSADGEANGKDMATRKSSRNPKGSWLISRTAHGQLLKPRTQLENSTWSGVKLHPANYTDLRLWFKRHRRVIKPGDTLVLYVTDHGQAGKDDPDNGTISLWNDDLSVTELRGLLGHLKPEVRVIMLMSQCFSGTFASAMFPLGKTVPGGNTCGYFSTTHDRYAFGCYPEGRAQQRLGHAFTLVDALHAQRNLQETHNQVTLRDGSPDVPLRTSDVYLERVLEQEAKATNTTLHELADSLLATALHHQEIWKEELNVLEKLAKSYGLPAPKTLSEADATFAILDKLAEELTDVSERWKDAYTDLQTSNLKQFLATRPYEQRWARRLSLKELKKLDPRKRRMVLEQVSPDLLEFTQRRAETMRTLKKLRAQTRSTFKTQYRMEVRAAVILRMRARLLQIAGRTLLARKRSSTRPSTADREAIDAFEKLRQCEAAPLGVPTGTDRPPAQTNLTTLRADLTAFKKLRPGWLGIRYNKASPSQVSKHNLAGGAVVVSSVEAESPAMRAGVRPSDIIAGTPARLFQTPGELRNWVVTAPKGVQQKIVVVRGGAKKTLAVMFAAMPVEGLGLLLHSKVGDRSTPPIPNMEHKPYVLFFLTPKCTTCKSAVTALMAWSLRAGVKVVVVGETEQALQEFFAQLPSPLPPHRFVDTRRAHFKVHGVEQGAAFIAVDQSGTIRHRQMQYTPNMPLSFETWRPNLKTAPKPQ